MSPPIKESDFWKSVRANLANSHTHLCRVENDAGTGIFDVSACSNGNERWIELKVFHGRRIHFRASQHSWCVRHTEVGGKCLVLARKEDEVFLWRAMDLMNVANTKVEVDGKSFSILYEDLPQPIFRAKKPVPWDSLRAIIFA